MKQIKIIAIMCLLIVNVVFAATNFEIRLIAYNPETQSSQIGIKNIGTQDYHEVTMAIDGLQPVRIVGLLKQGNEIKIPKGIPNGKHTITVSCQENITVKKEIDFPRSQAQIQRELDIKKNMSQLVSAKEAKTTAQGVYDTKPKIKISWIIFGAFLLAFLIYLLLRLRKRNLNQR